MGALVAVTGIRPSRAEMEGKEMAKSVWVSAAMVDEKRMMPMRSDIALTNVDDAVEAIRQNNSGVSLPKDRFPNEVFGSSDSGTFEELPDFFSADGYWVVSEACAKVFKGFDLESGGLYPVRIFQKDRKTPVPGDYYCLNFGSVKEAFQPEGSPKAYKSQHGGDFWMPPFVVKDGDIAVSEAALAGSDLWVDPKIMSVFFVSGGLAKALKAAKINLGLRRCRIS
ncbi:MAG: hypothetical protein Tsb0019_27190 [Roseibium sp.]